MELEGGSTLVNRSDDPGGLTKYGISQRAYPLEDIANLTEERARFLADRDYWLKAKCDRFSDPIAMCLFDSAFLQGPETAMRLMQSALGVKADGNIGSVTLSAVKSFTTKALLKRFMQARSYRYLSMDNHIEEANEKGWQNRLIAVLCEAAFLPN